MYRTIALLVSTGLLATAAQAQVVDPNRAYIDAGFAAMDANKDGNVTPVEFDSFMQARLARQAARFDAAFQEIDANHDGKITPAEAKVVPQLSANFTEVDTNGDRSISKDELRSAAAAARAEEVADN